MPIYLKPVLIIIALAIFGAVGYGAGYRVGSRAGYGQAAGEITKDKDAVISALRQDIAAERASALALSAARSEAVSAANKYRSSLAKAIRDLDDEKAKPVPGCIPDALRVRINSAVFAANSDSEGSPGIVPDRLSGSSSARGGFRPVDIRGDPILWGVQGNTQHMPEDGALND